ncbi:hypothetical protein [Pyruvatibacter mobilis]|uniref:hypothetical protein n=1 Tax=Pyruvatibacter mobilis TaxID=1712261 RepID=UPI003C7E12FE
MSTEARQMAVNEVDEFLAHEKRLIGSPPEWRKSTRGGELEALWNIADELGVSSAHLRFRFVPTRRIYPSISVIHRNQPVWRIDLAPPTLCKANPPFAAEMGMEPTVCGSHAHRWDDNRSHILSQDVWDLPARTSIQPQVRRIRQALAMLAEDINLTLEPYQRAFDEPAQGELF